MSFLQKVTVLILTFNEASNIGRTLDALRAFPEVVVLDSGSSDETLAIVGRYPNVRVRNRSFDNHSTQWNHGLIACGLQQEWVLALDADYVLPSPLVDEIAALAPSAGQSGYRLAFRYCVFGTPLSATLYPPSIALYRRRTARYVQDGHTQRLQLTGGVTDLRHRIDHDDRKPLGRWLTSQGNYALLEARSLRTASWADLKLQDKIRRLIFVAPWLVPLYCLTVGRGFLDGRAGWFYALQRGMAESVLALQLLELQLREGR